MLELANTTPANGKKKKETYAKEQGVQAPPEHAHKKNKVWNSSKGSRNLGLIIWDLLRALNNVSFFGTVCVGGRLVGREGLFLGSSLGPSSP